MNDEEGDDDLDESVDRSSFRDGEFSKKQKDAILKFLNKATFDDMCAAKGISEKKAELLVGMRPFKSFYEIQTKASKMRNLGVTWFDGIDRLLLARDTLTNLLKKCAKLAHQIENDEKMDIVAPPAQIQNNKAGFKMKSYQIAGLNWLIMMNRNLVNGILADEMGLGKTVQTIAFLTYLCEQDPLRKKGPHIIIVPASTLDNWLRELSFWAPGMKVICYYGSQDERKIQRKDIFKCMKFQDEVEKGGICSESDRPFDVVLTTYTCSMSSSDDRMTMRKIKFQYAVFDEGHMVKNMNSQRYQQLSKINAKRRLLLTGTPLQNNLLELISLLKFIMPSLFDRNQTADALTQIFGNADLLKNESEYMKSKVEQAREIMKPFVLRRLKINTLLDLPPKTSSVEQCKMNDFHEKVYFNALKEIQRRLDDPNYTKNQNSLMHLRKIATHPSLIRNQFTMARVRQMSKALFDYKRCENEQYQYEDLCLYNDFELNEICLNADNSFLKQYAFPREDIVNKSSKFKKLDELLPQIEEKGGRVLIFSQFTMLLDILQVYLKLKKTRYLRLDGTTPVQDRLDLIDLYNNDKSLQVFILSTKAGGLGINLSSADTVIIHDLDMNPYNDKQAEDRCHRFGQTKPVHIYRLLTKSTVDISIYKRATAKLKLEHDMTVRKEKKNGAKSKDGKKEPNYRNIKKNLENPT